MNFADHNVVGIMLTIPHNQTPQHTCTWTRTRNRNKADINYVRQELNRADWHPVTEAESVDDKWARCIEIIDLAIDSHSPLTKSYTCGCSPITKIPYRQKETHVPQNLALLREQRDRLRNKWGQAKRKNAPNKLELGAEYRAIRNKCNNTQRQLNDSHWRNKLANVNNTKDRFAIINDILGRRNSHRTINAIQPGGNKTTLVTDPLQIADQMNKYFASVGAGGPHASALSFVPSPQPHQLAEAPAFRFKPPSCTAVYRQLRACKKNKPAGPDKLQPRVLNDCASQLTFILTHIFESCITTNTIPKAWKISRVSAIHKKDSELDPTNYRPISISDAVGKLLEALLNVQMSDYLSHHALLCNNQFGFRKSMSCQDAVVHLTEGLRKELEQKRDAIVIYLDLTKAFDCLNHDILCQILASSFKFSFSAVQLVRSFLSDRQQYVTIGKTKSSLTDIKTGVPQGSIVGPLWFSMYVNSLASFCPDMSVIQYADDTALSFASDDLVRDSPIIMANIENLCTGLESLRLRVNSSKTQVQILTRKTTPIPLQLTINNTQLELTETAKYLGVTIDNKLDMKAHIDTVLKKQRMMLHAFRKIRHRLTVSTALLFHKTIILPNFDFACVPTEPHTKEYADKLETIHNSSLRIALRSKCSREQLRNQATVTSLKQRREFFLLCLVFRSLHKIGSTLISDLFRLDSPRPDGRSMRSVSSRDSHTIAVPAHRSRFMSRSVKVRGSLLWNALPKDIREIQSFSTFKAAIRANPQIVAAGRRGD
jgi:hypothetical protein